jgi:phosphoserine phosphatase
MLATTTDAALFRLEGALSPRPTLTAAAWMAVNAQRVRSRVLGTFAMAIAAPLSMRDPSRAGALAWASLEGMSEDRLIVLGEIYARDHVVPALSRVGLDLLERSRAAGRRIVLLSDNLDVVVRPVAEHLAIDDVLCNAMEIDRGRATGVLREPRFGPAIGGRVLKEALGDRGIDLARASAYGSCGDDSVLLSAAALPCAVSPDRALRRMARDLDWPVVEEDLR